jgi:hypothetical protein
MSKIALSGNPSGTGTFTLASPNSNTDRTLNLPDAAGTLALTSQIPAAPTIASTAEAEAGTNNTNFITPLRMREGFNATGSAPVYACRAWVNFDGTTSPGTIRASGNVSSVTKNGTGDYTVNFTTALPDINFSINGMCSIVLGNNVPVVFDNSTIRARTTTSSSIRTMDAGNFGDPVWVNIAVFR